MTWQVCKCPNCKIELNVEIIEENKFDKLYCKKCGYEKEVADWRYAQKTAFVLRELKQFILHVKKVSDFIIINQLLDEIEELESK